MNTITITPTGATAYISLADSNRQGRILYTELVGGSNPSSPTIFYRFSVPAPLEYFSSQTRQCIMGRLARKDLRKSDHVPVNMCYVIERL
jgi:hypothetical protein